MVKKIILICLFPSCFLVSFSQEKSKNITLDGYLTSMQTVIFDSLSGPFTNENLLHNRLNFRGYISDKITMAIEFRNRLFTGDLVRTGKIYSDLIGTDPGVIDMSWNIFEKQSFLLNAKIDRLWVDFHYTRFEATIGRQRINWGQTFVWNPNDIFNAYSFFDFDYVERPGSDAIRLQFFPTSSSVAETALKVDNEQRVTVAGLYRFNKWSYDIQFLAGLVNSEDVVLGAGWSGAIGNISFRGEASWFQPYEEFPQSSGTIMITTGFDKILKDNSTAQIQVMYCNNPLRFVDFNSLYTGNLSAKDLAFSKFTAFGQFTWAVTPLLNLTFAGMWFPDLDGYFAGPSLDYSLSENIDFSVVWQHFAGELSGSGSRINFGYLRLKYSF